MWQLPTLLLKCYIRVQISMLISQFPGKANSPMGQYWFLHQRTFACLLEWEGSSVPKGLEQAPKEHIDECSWAVCQNWYIFPPFFVTLWLCHSCTSVSTNHWTSKGTELPEKITFHCITQGCNHANDVFTDSFTGSLKQEIASGNHVITVQKYSESR